FVIDHYGRTLGAISLLRHGFVSGFKIDKSLTLELGTSMRVRMMVPGHRGAGKSLGLSVAAEGVEDTAQRAFVTTAQCASLSSSRKGSEPRNSRPRPALRRVLPSEQPASPLLLSVSRS
ncbi:EAL domain-containing protein, partial [Pantoea rodasii]|uniref:EAL domain-containing protein n=1 Tax=Pantoea rodasii TaxID=1076549 RepID=UPI000FFBB12F